MRECLSMLMNNKVLMDKQMDLAVIDVCGAGQALI